ncbi:MAG: hypothetical protein NTY74_05620 [Ignavibacteriae bacterium]|nr:hypothetical protein [Ignavibacteriota bacterium]
MSIPDIVENNSEEQKMLLYEAAFDKFILKDDDEAVAILDDLLEIDEENADAYSMRATCLNNLGFHLDAIDDYRKSLELKDDANINGLCGNAYMAIGDYKQACGFLEKAVNDGLKIYNFSLLAVTEFQDNELMLKTVKQKAEKENRLKRRTKTKIEYDLNSSPREVINALKDELSRFKAIFELDPENKELKDLYDESKQKLKLFSILIDYLKRTDNFTIENLIKDLMEIDYNSIEATELATMYIKEFANNDKLNKQIVESIRDEMKESIRNDFKDISGKEISENLSNELYEMLKEKYSKKFGEDKLSYLNLLYKSLIQVFIESPLFLEDSINDLESLNHDIKNRIPKEATYLAMYSIIKFSLTSKSVIEKYDSEDIGTAYPIAVKEAISEFGFYYKAQTLDYVEYELNHNYYEICLKDVNDADTKVNKLALSFMMKVHQFDTKNLDINNKIDEENLLGVYNIGKKVIETVKESYRRTNI